MRIAASEVLGISTSYQFKAHNVPHGLGDYKGSEPQSALKRMAQMLNIEETGHRFRPIKIGAIEFPMDSNHSMEDHQ